MRTTPVVDMTSHETLWQSISSENTTCAALSVMSSIVAATTGASTVEYCGRSSAEEGCSR